MRWPGLPSTWVVDLDHPSPGWNAISPSMLVLGFYDRTRDS